MERLRVMETRNMDQGGHQCGRLWSHDCPSNSIGSQVLSALHGYYTSIKDLTTDERHSGNDPKIVFRYTKAPTDGPIAFHHDGAHATGTVQVALNDSSEYSGGR